MVLKIIGMTLLIILGILLIVIMLILVVPVRYRIYAIKDEEDDIKVNVKVGWLLRFVTVTVDYYKELFYRVKVLFFTIKKSDNLKKIKPKERKNQKKEEITNSSDDSVEQEEIEIKPYATESIPVKEDNFENTEEDIFTENNDESEIVEDEEKISLFNKICIAINKIIDFFVNIGTKIEKIEVKIKEIFENTEYYIDAVNDERNRTSFKLIKDELGVVLNNIKPRKIKGFVHYGSLDPYNMGQVLTIYSILFPLIHDKIQFVSDYDRDIIEGNITIKGRITLAIVLYVFVKVYFNKDVKRMIKIFKRE